MSIRRFVVFLYIETDIWPFFDFPKIPNFSNGDILLHAGVEIASVTAQPSLASYTETTKGLRL